MRFLLWIFLTVSASSAIAQPFFAGFHNKAQTQLLAPRPDQAANLLPVLQKASFAICGKIPFKIKFKAIRERSVDSNGRQASYNFENEGGVLFDIVEKLAPKSEAEDDEAQDYENPKLGDCFLFQSEHAAQMKFLTVYDHSLKTHPATKAEIAQLALAKNRKVKQAWKAVSIEGGDALYLVRYVNYGKNALASFAMQLTNQWVFFDMPAKVNTESGTFRVDDEDEITPESMRFFFAYRAEGALHIGAHMHSTEGNSMAIFKIEKNRIKRFGAGYLYQAPI